jgi:hypothetical protein
MDSIFLQSDGVSTILRAVHFTSGRPVVRAQTAQGKKRFVAYHPREFVLRTLPPGLRVLSHTDSSDIPALSQDVWVLTTTAMMPPGAAGDQRAPPARLG